MLNSIVLAIPILYIPKLHFVRMLNCLPQILKQMVSKNRERYEKFQPNY